MPTGLRWYTGPTHATRRSVEGAALSGCQQLPFAIDVGEQRQMVGVKFKPGGAAPFLGAPAHETLGLNVPLAELWTCGREIREQLLDRSGSPRATLATLDRLLLARLDERFLVNPGISWAIEALKRGERVGAIAARGTDESQCHR